MFGLQQGHAVLKEINQEMSVESVEKLMEDTADAIAYQEVSQKAKFSVDGRKFPTYWRRGLRMRRKKKCSRSLNNCRGKPWNCRRCRSIHWARRKTRLRRGEYPRQNQRRKEWLCLHDRNDVIVKPHEKGDRCARRRQRSGFPARTAIALAARKCGINEPIIFPYCASVQ